MSWTSEASGRISRLKNELERVGNFPTESSHFDTDCREKLIQLERGLNGWPYLRGLLSGDGAKCTWAELHEIEEAIYERDDDVERLTARAMSYVRAELPAHVGRAKQDLRDKSKSSNYRLHMARQWIHDAHEAAANIRSSQRNQQRWLYLSSMVLLCLAIFSLFLQSVTEGSFLPPVPGEEDLPDTLILGTVMVFGALGGVLSGVVSLSVVPKVPEVTRWVDPKPALLVTKLSLGIWTGVIGVAAVGTQLLVGVYQSLPALVLLAVIFGYSQQALTTFLDERATALLNPPAEAAPITTATLACWGELSSSPHERVDSPADIGAGGALSPVPNKRSSKVPGNGIGRSAPS